MEDQDKRDRLIRELVGKVGAETPSAGFTEKLMARVKSQPAADDTPLLTRGTWISLVLAVAAVIFFIFTLDIPVFSRVFSASGMQKVSMDLFSIGFFNTMAEFFKNLEISGISLSILLAATGLALLERAIHQKITDARVFFLHLFV